MNIFIYDSQSDQVKDTRNKIVCCPIKESHSSISNEKDLVAYLEKSHGFDQAKDALLINGIMH